MNRKQFLAQASFAAMGLFIMRCFGGCSKSIGTSATNAQLLTGPPAPTDITHFNSYGQSLAIGGSGSATATAYSIKQQYDSVMFNLGVRSRSFNKMPVSFSPLVETISGDGIYGETLCAGFADSFIASVKRENMLEYTDKGFQLHAASSGEGGKSVDQLGKGTAYYNRLVNDIQTAQQIATKMEKKFSVGFIGWTQGEEDYSIHTPYATYQSKVKQLLANINADVRDITRQNYNIPFIIGQTSSGNNHPVNMTDPVIAQAQLDLCLTEPDMIFASAMYFLDYYSPKNMHLSAVSYRILAHYYGLAAKRFIMDGEKFMPVYPKLALLNGTSLEVQFHVPVLPLVFDTKQVINPGNYGFKVFSSTNAKIDINTVELTSADTVTFNLSASPAGGKLYYAVNGKYEKFGRMEGQRGCLRDSQGDLIKADPDGLNFPLHNWAPIFKYQLP